MRVRHREWMLAAAGYFAFTTVWTVLLSIGDGGDDPFTAAGAILCFAMWA